MPTSTRINANTPNKTLAAELCKASNSSLLTGILRGLEKESLRVTQAQTMSQRPHPLALGSSLTHPHITTDFSEALLEFITPPNHQRKSMMQCLEQIHRFTNDKLEDEFLWASSMPCRVAGEHDIPVALYGSSNRGKMKTVYRHGLSHRYGKTMQTVAGLHYNFSLPKTFWAYLHQFENSAEDLTAFTTNRYFDLIRNFRRYYWLLLYLFGASPAMCKSFVKQRTHNFDSLPHDSSTLYLPYATALRMGDLGYQSAAQEQLFVCYNTRQTYVQTLVDAIHSNYAEYADIGLKDNKGNYKQLNTGILQIENEFYSPIRPKRTANPGETALMALCQRGVEYVEVRCLDLDPFEPLGFSEQQSQFIDTFLLFCLLKDSPECTQEEFSVIQKRHAAVVNEGRKPGLSIENDQGDPVNMQQWASQLLEEMGTAADILDASFGGNEHLKSLTQQKAKVANPQLTPSARVLAALERDKLSFTDWTTKISKQHQQHIMSKAQEPATEQRFDDMAIESIRLQEEEEKQAQSEFDTYLKEYYSQYSCCE